jgi:hypothetical protein
MKSLGILSLAVLANAAALPESLSMFRRRGRVTLWDQIVLIFARREAPIRSHLASSRKTIGACSSERAEAGSKPICQARASSLGTVQAYCCKCNIPHSQLLSVELSIL